MGISYSTCYNICCWIWALFPAPNRNAKLSWLEFSSIVCFNFPLVFRNSFLGFCQSQLENVSCTLSFQRKDIVKCLSYQNLSIHFVIIHFVIFFFQKSFISQELPWLLGTNLIRTNSPYF